MAKQLYVGNLPDTVTDEDLLQLFSQAGVVMRAEAARDEGTGRPAGFGLVEMSTDEEADRSVSLLNGYPMDDRRIEVRRVTEKELEGYPPSYGGLTSAG